MAEGRATDDESSRQADADSTTSRGRLVPHDYNFAAADRLERELNQLMSRLDTFIGLRARQRKALLGKPHSDNWQGRKRLDNDTQYSRQRNALIGLKERARILKGQVSAATAEAHKARKPEPGGHTPTPSPGTSPAPR